MRERNSALDNAMKPNTYVIMVLVVCMLFLTWAVFERVRYELEKAEHLTVYTSNI